MSSVQQYLPLSENQRGLWHLQTVHPDLTAYNTASVFRLRSCLDSQRLQCSLHQLVAEQPLLRTTFILQDDTPYQVVHDRLPPAFNHILLPDVDETELRARVQAAHDCPFDLSNGPLVRLTVFSRAEADHVLLLNFHHILLDFGSHGRLTKRLFDLYATDAKGETAGTSGITSQPDYADFVAWQQTHLSSPAGAKSSDYWAQQLQSPLPVLDLPTDHPLPRQQTFNGAVYRFVLTDTLSQALTALARSQQVMPFALLLTAFAVLMARYSRQDDLIVGIPSDERVRTRQRFQHTLGHMINLLPIRVNLADQPTFVDLVKRVQTVVLGGLWHQNYPFARMVQNAHWLHDPSRSPLFDVAFNMPVLEKVDDCVTLMEGTPMQPTVYKGLRLEPFDFCQQAGQSFLELDLWLTDSGMVGFLKYNSDLFDETTIARMANHFAVLLNGIAQHPDQPVLQLPMLTDAEYRQIVHEWNDTSVDFGEPQTMHALFEQQVARTPDAVAVVMARKGETRREGEGENLSPCLPVSPSPCLTYAELNTRANHLAHYLQRLGVGPDVIVGLLATRSLDFLTAILAIFKAGGAYLPLEPRNPMARHTQILQQSQCPYVLCADPFISELAEALTTTATTSQRVPMLLSLETSLAQKSSHANPSVNMQPHHLAYVIFTSGSTGLPKGAMVEQRGMVNHLYAKIKDLNLVAADRVAQTASQAFDISVWQFLAALVVGGSVHIYPDEISLNPDRLLRQVEEDRITIWETVPSLMRAILESLQQAQPDASQGSNQPLQEKRWSLAALRWLIPTGEALPPALANQWLTLYPQIPLLNAYGPTECSDDVTHYPIDQPLPPTVVNTPIGRPVYNMRAYILDCAMQPTPVGVPGELWIGGIGVGRGYLYDVERTVAAFVPDPFDANNTTARLYKTGDLARWQISTDGVPVIEFLGRADFQVKIRGFRIELGEIENVLLAQNGVQEAVVLAREDTPGAQRLVAYLVGEADPDTLRQRLAQRLPDYMIPAAFVVLAKMPLTPNGKLDRRALPAPDYAAAQTTFVAARNALETQLVALWQEVLHVDRIGVYDNFFALGGHSLMAMTLLNKLQERLKAIIHITALFESPSIAQLADYLYHHYPESVERLIAHTKNVTGRYEPATTEGLSKTNPEAHVAEAGRTIIDETIDETALRKIQAAFAFSSSPTKVHPPQTRNKSAIFLFSAPRTGSTLLRVILAGHSRLFAPPELGLLGFQTLTERKRSMPDENQSLLDGPVYALREIENLDVAAARTLMQQFEDRQLTIPQFYHELQTRLGERRLVDKTPTYALHLSVLRAAERTFTDNRYLFLVRHPYGMIHSFAEARLDLLWSQVLRQRLQYTRLQVAELIWLLSYRNIRSFANEIPSERQHWVRFEDLVNEPQATVEGICNFLQITFQPAMLQPYLEQKQRMTAGFTATTRMLGDIKFHQHTTIDTSVADHWQQHYSSDFLSDLTWEVARSFGYAPIKRVPVPQHAKTIQMDTGQRVSKIQRISQASAHPAQSQIEQLSDQEVQTQLQRLLAKRATHKELKS